MKNKVKSHILVLISVIIFTLISILPTGLLGIVAVAVLASLIGYTATKYHYYFLSAACALVLFIYFIFIKDVALALLISVPTVLIGLTLGICYNLKMSEAKTIGIITGIYTVNTVLNLKLSGIDAQNITESLFGASFDEFRDTFASIYEEQITNAQFEETLTIITSQITKLAPAILIVACGILALFMLFVFKKVLKITKSDTSHFKPFCEWSADKTFVVAYLVIAVLGAFAPEESYVYVTLSNVSLVAQFVLFVFGLAFWDLILKKRIKRKASRRAIVILIALFSVGFLFNVLYILGAIAGITGLRNRFLNDNSSEQE